MEDDHLFAEVGAIDPINLFGLLYLGWLAFANSTLLLMKVYVNPGSKRTLRIFWEQMAPIVSAVRMLIGVSLLESCSVSG